MLPGNSKNKGVPRLGGRKKMVEDDMSPNPNFNHRLNQLMQEQQMTVREAGKYAGVAPSTVQNWRSGHVPTDFVAVRRLAAALGVSFSFLLTGEDDFPQQAGNKSITECFAADGILFDGYARVKIEKLRPLKNRQGK
jgi:transcriptional regulator with XRE-family HTH domain